MWKALVILLVKWWQWWLVTQNWPLGDCSQLTYFHPSPSPQLLVDAQWRSSGFAHSTQNRSLEAREEKQDVKTVFLFYSPLPSQKQHPQVIGGEKVAWRFLWEAIFGSRSLSGALLENAYPSITHYGAADNSRVKGLSCSFFLNRHTEEVSITSDTYDQPHSLVA